MEFTKRQTGERSWLHGYDWQKVREAILGVSEGWEGQLKDARRVACEIHELYGDISRDLERVSQKICPDCRDVCCRHATVWYDIKDLLYIYCYSGELPEKQIYRRDDGSCCCLTESGCTLDRSLRPFICTWYICPDQKEELGAGHELYHHLELLKGLRMKLAKMYSFPSGLGLS